MSATQAQINAASDGLKNWQDLKAELNECERGLWLERKFQLVLFHAVLSHAVLVFDGEPRHEANLCLRCIEAWVMGLIELLETSENVPVFDMELEMAVVDAVAFFLGIDASEDGQGD